jgi:hypothetical protein
VLGEDGRAATSRLDEGVAVTVGNLSSRHGEQAGERSEHEVDLVLADQVLVVRRHLIGTRRVIDDLQYHRMSVDPALAIHDACPGLVTLLRGSPRIGEVTGQRERDANRDG